MITVTTNLAINNRSHHAPSSCLMVQGQCSWSCFFGFPLPGMPFFLPFLEAPTKYNFLFYLVIWTYENFFFFASSVRKPLTSSNMTEPDVYHVQHLQDQTQRAPPLCFCCGCEMGHPVRDHWWSRLQGADIDDTSHPDRKQAHLWVCCVQYQNEGPWLHLDLQVEEQREEPGHMGPGRCGSTVRSKGDPHSGTLFPSAPGGTQGGFFVRSLDCSQAH